MNRLEQINEETRAAYNLAADKYHELFQNEMEEKEFDRKLLDKFAEQFSPSSKILDAGCGPSAHIGKYLYDKGLDVAGVDISDRCIEIAKEFNPMMNFSREDIGQLSFDENSFDGIVSYYSIIDTPKNFVEKIFNEFYRVLKPGGKLLVVVKAGDTEGYESELLGIITEIYFTLFRENEIRDYFESADLKIEYIETRNPYDFEIDNQRIYSIGSKPD